MSLAIVQTRVTVGIHSQAVTVEIHLANGLPAFNIVGLPEKAVQESRERVRAALNNCEFEFPTRRITVNLAPADLPKEGSGFDLPIAIGILAASEQIPLKALQNCEFIGELALSGDIRPVNGILPVALGTQNAGHQLIFPARNANEVTLVKDLTAYAAGSLLRVTAHLNKLHPIEALAYNPPKAEQALTVPDMSDVKGQPQARRALTIAAAGNHSLLMIGPPGSGKSMLAARLPGLLPELSEQQAIETAAIHSISDQSMQLSQWLQPPYRSPHHSASAAALVGGGSNPKPGEISLAHNGVLFLDELTEFQRSTLDVLREPLENGYIRISRVARKTEYPANFQLIAAMNPCPCGYLGDEKRACGTCTAEQIKRYQGRVSGPILDRIDLHVEVPNLPASQLMDNTAAESSASLKLQVLNCRKIQLSRTGSTNNTLNSKQIETYAMPDKHGLKLLQQAIDKLGLSARAWHRILRVSRTIADLENAEKVAARHVGEAIGYRRLDRLM